MKTGLAALFDHCIREVERKMSPPVEHSPNHEIVWREEGGRRLVSIDGYDYEAIDDGQP